MKKKLLFNVVALTVCVMFSLVKTDVSSGNGFVVQVPHGTIFLYDGPFKQGTLFPEHPSSKWKTFRHYGEMPHDGEYGKMVSLALSWRFGDMPHSPFWEMEHYRTADAPADARLPEWSFYGKCKKHTHYCDDAVRESP